VKDELARWKIRLTPGENYVEVNGDDVTSQIDSLQINAASGGQPPVLQLRLTGDGELEGAGVVAVSSADPILEWLDQIDAEDLENAVMSATMLNVLKDFARRGR
jgi:hypothetical protein